MEATVESSEGQDIYVYGYVTYDKTKLKGPQVDKIRNYNINAFGRIPTIENEFLDMSLITDKGNQLLDFRMTYVRNFTDRDDDTLLGTKFKQHIRTLNIRTDIGRIKATVNVKIIIHCQILFDIFLYSNTALGVVYNTIIMPVLYGYYTG